MHDKLKLLLDKINTPKEYYDYFLNGKILKLKLDHTRRNGIFVIEVEKPLDIEVIKYINENIRIGFPSMESVKASFVIKNKNYDDFERRLENLRGYFSSIHAPIAPQFIYRGDTVGEKSEEKRVEKGWEMWRADPYFEFKLMKKEEEI